MHGTEDIIQKAAALPVEECIIEYWTAHLPFVSLNTWRSHHMLRLTNHFIPFCCPLILA